MGCSAGAEPAPRQSHSDMDIYLYIMYKYNEMTDEDYRGALAAAIEEYEALGAKRREIDARLAQLAQTIGTLSRLIGLTPTVPLGPHGRLPAGAARRRADDAGRGSRSAAGDRRGSLDLHERSVGDPHRAEAPERGGRDPPRAAGVGQARLSVADAADGHRARPRDREDSMRERRGSSPCRRRHAAGGRHERPRRTDAGSSRTKSRSTANLQIRRARARAGIRSRAKTFLPPGPWTIRGEADSHRPARTADDRRRSAARVPQHRGRDRSGAACCSTARPVSSQP